MPKEPEKEMIRIGDILRWIPGVTDYQVNKQVEAGNLREIRLGEGGHRFFLKEQVRATFLNTQPTK